MAEISTDLHRFFHAATLAVPRTFTLVPRNYTGFPRAYTKSSTQLHQEGKAEYRVFGDATRAEGRPGRVCGISHPGASRPILPRNYTGHEAAGAFFHGTTPSRCLKEISEISFFNLKYIGMTSRCRKFLPSRSVGQIEAGTLSRPGMQIAAGGGNRGMAESGLNQMNRS